MARPLRHLVPGTRWFVTFRCLEAMHLLRPDPASVALFGYWLVRALARFPGIRLAAVVQMSNHGHLTLEDADGVLADFMEYFLGNLARGMNALRGRRGTFFERRYSAEPILDDEAFLARIHYTIANPVKSKLVRHHREWPGLVTFAGDPEKWAFQRGQPDEPSDEPETLHLELPEVQALLDADAERLRRELDEHEAELHEANGRWAVGAAEVLAQDPFSSPERPKRSPRPLCHASTPEARKAFQAAWRLLQSLYRRASELWRGGDFSVEFPAYTFRPHVFVGAT